MRTRVSILASLVVVAACAPHRVSTPSTHSETTSPPAFSKIAEPETISTIDAPRFVSPNASGYHDDEPVLGLVTPSGAARAYSLWQLERTPIVNDAADDLSFAIVLDPVSGAAGAFLRTGGASQTHGFGVSGLVHQDAFVVHDRESATMFDALTGHGVAGPRAQDSLEDYPTLRTEWSVWRALHPDSSALLRAPENANALQNTGVSATTNPLGLDGAAWVVAVRATRAARAYPLAELANVVNETVGELPIAIVPVRGGALAIVRGDHEFTLNRDVLVDSTGARFSIDGRAFDSDERCAAAPFVRVVRWAAWYRAYPGTTLWRAAK